MVRKRRETWSPDVARMKIKDKTILMALRATLSVGELKGIQRFSQYIHAFDESRQLLMVKRTYSGRKINGTYDSYVLKAVINRYS